MHEDAIQDLQIAADGASGITASLDKTAKLIDLDTFETLKTYRTGRFVQSAAMSPIFDHVSNLPVWDSIATQQCTVRTQAALGRSLIQQSHYNDGLLPLRGDLHAMDLHAMGKKILN